MAETVQTLYRFFRGRETKQVAVGGRPAYRTLWYYEPRDYEGDTLWSAPHHTRQHAVMAAKRELDSTPA